MVKCVCGGGGGKCGEECREGAADVRLSGDVYLCSVMPVKHLPIAPGENPKGFFSSLVSRTYPALTAVAGDGREPAGGLPTPTLFPQFSHCCCRRWARTCWGPSSASPSSSHSTPISPPTQNR